MADEVKPATPESSDEPVFVRTAEGQTIAVTRAEYETDKAAGLYADATEITGEQIGQRARDIALEQQFGGAGEQAITALEGALSGATFGLIPETEQAALRAEANPGMRVAGEIGSGLALSVLSGGSGAAGALARATPVGRLSAWTGKIAASGGRGVVGTVARGAVAGALEGAADNGARYLAETVLDEDKEFSAAGLLAQAGTGALFGGAFGAAAAGAGRIADGLAARSIGEGGMLDGLVEQADVIRVRGRKVRGPQESVLGDGLVRDRSGRLIRRDEYVTYDQVVSPRLQEDAPEYLGALAKRVDDAATAPVKQQVKDMLDLPEVKAAMGDRGARVERKFQKLTDEYDRAAAKAKEVMTRYMEAIQASAPSDAAGLASEALPTAAKWNVPDGLDNELVDSLAALDRARTGLKNAVDTVRVSAPTAAPDFLPDVTSTVAGKAVDTSPGALARIAGTVETTLGGLEVANDVGLGGPSVRSIPVVGELMSWYLKLKAGVNAGKKLGLIRRTGPVSAAVKVNETRARIAASVRGAVRRAASSPVPVIAAGKLGAQVAQLKAQDPAEVKERAMTMAEGGGLGVAEQAGTQAVQALQYLQAKAPRNHLEGSPFAEMWAPTALQQRQWAQLLLGVDDPLMLMDKMLAGEDLDYGLAAETLQATNRPLYDELRRQVAAEAETLIKTRPEGWRSVMGRALGIPLTLDQLPGYRGAVSLGQGGERPAQAQAPQVRRAAPRTAATSPQVTFELTDAQARERERRR